MREQKISFIENELNTLAKKVDGDIRVLVAILNNDKTDIDEVCIIYNNGYDVRVNVECDSLLAIAKDVLKRI